ncbi:VOC family protein [Qipengyuania flava]|uniref:VOC family protein n=1 Tax=Qipengyuania flava TaxID=192812 RepID=UPI003BB16E54
MDKTIFVNLPVADLASSTAFYEGIGFVKNDKFSNELASGMTWTDTIHVMLLTHEFWKTFTDKQIPDASKVAQVLLCLGLESRAAVDAMVERAAAIPGGRADPTPTQDMGFMYGRSFEDPDGHIWEISWMDPEAMENGSGELAEAQH